MLRLIKLLLVLFSLLQASGYSEIKVVASNIEWFPGGTPNPKPLQEQRHMEVAREELREMTPDIFIGIEIKDWKSFKKLVSVIPGLRPAVVSRFKEAGEVTAQQIGIASRYPVNSAWYEEWSPSKFPLLRRGFAFAAIEDPREWGKLLLVYGVHLKSNRLVEGFTEQDNFDARNEAARQLVSHYERMLQVYHPAKISGAIIAGDFNTNHDGQFGDQVFGILEEAGFYNTFKDVPKGKRLTWRGRGNFQGTTFDYIMTKGLGQLKARMIVTPEQYSDHNAVELKIP